MQESSFNFPPASVLHHPCPCQIAERADTLCWQIHRGLAVSVPLLRMWVHCPRASNGLLPLRSNLVGYVRWDARSDRFPPCQTIIPTAFRSQSGLPVSRDLTKLSHLVDFAAAAT